MTATDSKVNISELSQRLQRFGWPDYAVFVLMLVICLFIGFYYGFTQRNLKKGRRGSEAQNYLVGGRNMAVLPVAISLVSSWCSGISLLGTSTEIYLYGTQYMFFILIVFLSSLAVGHIFLPVFHDLKLTSMYEYLELRFDKRIRLLGSILFTISSFIWLPIVIFVPALSFNQVTGISIHILTPIVCLVCIVYTLLGGLKAVVWTDVIQGAAMYGSIIAIIVLGTINVGGFGEVWNRNLNGGRLEYPEVSVDPKVRHSIFSITLGGFFYWISSSALNQHMMQRYMALRTLRNAQTAMWIFTVLVTFLLFICCYNGLLIFATYHDCDPLTTKLIKAKDQLLPLLVMDVLGTIPGLPGLFVAGIFSAALSSLSTALNSMAAVFLEDFYKPFANQPLSELQTRYFMRGVVLIVGIISVALVFVVEHLGSVLQLSMSLGGISSGPLLGIYAMGLLLPWTNSKGALIGGTAGLFTMAWLIVRAQLDISTGDLTFPPKTLTIDGCDYNFLQNITHSLIDESLSTSSDIDLNFHHMSYLFYCGFGATITVIVGTISSMIIGSLKPGDVDPILLAPFVRKIINPGHYLSQRPDIKEKNCIIHAFDVKDNQLT